MKTTTTNETGDSIIANLPSDLRHSVREYGINYPPLRERLQRMGGVHDTPHASSCACELCRLLRKGAEEA